MLDSMQTEDESLQAFINTLPPTRIPDDRTIEAPLEYCTPDLSSEFKQQILNLSRDWNPPPFEEVHGELLADHLRRIILFHYPDLVHATPPPRLDSWTPPEIWRDYLSFLWETQSFEIDIETWIARIKYELEMWGKSCEVAHEKRDATPLINDEDKMDL